MRISKVIILWCVIAPVFAQEDSRLNHLEQQLNILRETILDHETRLSEQQKHIEHLQGEKELLTHRLDEVKKQQQDIYLDLDERLRGLQATGPTPSPSSKEPSSPSADSPEKNSSSQSTPQSTLSAEPSAEITFPKGNEPFTGNDKQDYQEIFKEVLIKGNYQEVILKFGAFLKRYPQSEYASQAQYWIGDAQYASKQYEEALTTFKTLLEKFPNSPRSAQALLKMGYIYYEQKKFNDAKEMLKQARNLYPHSSSARFADERLRQIYQEGK